MATARLRPVERLAGERVRHVFSADHADEPVDDLNDLVFDQAAALAQGEGHVFADAHGIEERAVLEDHGDALADGAHVFFGVSVDLFAINADGADLGLEEAHEDAQGNRFSYAASAEDAESFTSIYVEAHVVENFAVVEPDGDVCEGDQGPGFSIGRHAVVVVMLFGEAVARTKLRNQLGELGVGGCVRHWRKNSLRDEVAVVGLGAEEILWGIDVEEPAGRGECLGMSELGALNQGLYWED